MAQRKLYRAKTNRVPDHYFVHFMNKTTAAAVKALVEELKQLDQDSTPSNFSVNIHGVVSRAGHGFAAAMSKEALDYVSLSVYSEFLDM